MGEPVQSARDVFERHMPERLRAKPDVVAKIKVVAGELPKRALRPAPRPLTAAEEAELAQWVAGIEDAGLREALARLGRKALGESRKTAIFKR